MVLGPVARAMVGSIRSNEPLGLGDHGSQELQAGDVNLRRLSGG